MEEILVRKEKEQKMNRPNTQRHSRDECAFERHLIQKRIFMTIHILLNIHICKAMHIDREEKEKKKLFKLRQPPDTLLHQWPNAICFLDIIQTQ
jgi:hypothetical protein